MVSLVAQPAMPLAIFLHHQVSKLCTAAEPVARPCHGGPCQLAALPQKMTYLTPWRVCPPWGWVGVASTGWIGSCPPYQTLRQSPHACQRRGLHQRGCFGLESGPDPRRHRRPPGHRSGPQHHPCKSPHPHLQRGHPPPHGRVWIHCWFPSCR